MIVDGEDALIWRIVEKYEHPLVKFADVHAKPVNEFLKERTTPGEIVNVTSLNFVSAVLQADAANPFEKL
jgi:hypothetical protein